MMRTGSCGRFFLSSVVLAAATLAGARAGAEPVRTDAGLVEGTVGSDPHVRAYRGIPFAARAGGRS